MIKTLVFIACTLALPALAQTDRDRISRDPDSPRSRTERVEPVSEPTSQTFTNQAGDVFSVEDLAAELRNLQAAVDQAKPMIEAFNQNFARTQTIAGALSGILSEALNRDKDTGGGDPDQDTRTSGKDTSGGALGALEGLLGGNPGNSGTAKPDAAEQRLLQNLQALQKQLQPVETTLEALAGPADTARGASKGSWDDDPITPKPTERERARERRQEF